MQTQWIVVFSRVNQRYLAAVTIEEEGAKLRVSGYWRYHKNLGRRDQAQSVPIDEVTSRNSAIHGAFRESGVPLEVGDTVGKGSLQPYSLN